MSTFLLVNKIFIFLIDVVGVYLGFWVYFSGGSKKLNKIFILMVVSMIFWVDFAYFARELIGTNNFLSLLSIKIAWTVTPLFFVFLYLLSIYLLEGEGRYKSLTKFVVFSGIIASLTVAFSDLIVKDITFIGVLLRIIYGKGMLPFLAIISFLIVATLYPLIKEYLKSSVDKRKKIEYFLLGIIIFYIANAIFNIILPVVFNITRLYFIGDYSTAILLGFTAFAIVKRNLFGMRVVLTSLLVGAIAILLLLDIFVFTPQFLIQLFKGLVLVIFLYFGYLLIKNILNEIKRREELERVTAELEVVNVKLDATYQSLKKLDDAKSEFISIASHQLRAPLTAIRGYTSMVLEGSYGKITQKSIGPLENILKSSDRLIKLVNDLLSISRIESGKMELELENISFVELVKDAAKELEIGAKNKNIYLRVEELKEILPQVFIDKDKIRQVILNIIDNAIKYTNKGGIDVSFEKGGGTVLAKISDTGIGFEKEEMEKMFGSFSRGSGKEVNTEGAGLGLYTARKFIEIHKGRIWAESQGKGRGSTFYIELPIK